jgi:peptidyl-tRNA hydrolase
MTEKDNDFVLYILMRTDLDSMNPGKAIAQGTHAANAFIEEHLRDSGKLEIEASIRDWRKQTTQGFGTVITLGVCEAQMTKAVLFAKEQGIRAGIVHDPSYPIRDGQVMHKIPLDTCGYIFGSHSDPKVRAIVGAFNLHP